MHRYLYILEKVPTGFSAFVPDLPGCVATGVSEKEVTQSIREAIEFHIDGLKEEGLEIPEPSSRADYAEIRPT